MNHKANTPPAKGNTVQLHQVKTEQDSQATGWEMAGWAKCLLPNHKDLRLGSHGISNLYTFPSTGGSETRGSLSSRFSERDDFKAKAGELAEWVKGTARD